MTLPFFYISHFNAAQKEIVLDEDVSRHIVNVVRMKKGEEVNLTDGKGNLLTAVIIDDHKKKCKVEITASSHLPPATRSITIGISLLKNTSRFEWFWEKATEIGINEIIPLLCDRTEKQKFRHERMLSICISAMLQSQQVWLPVLQEPVSFKQVIDQADQQQKFIAHCIEDEKRNLSDLVNETLPSQIILIGPEGDFTKEEIRLATQHHFDTVSLGDTRLRAETAGVVAATIIRLG